MKIPEQLGERVSSRKSLPAEAAAGVSAILQGQHLVDIVLEYRIPYVYKCFSHSWPWRLDSNKTRLEACPKTPDFCSLFPPISFQWPKERMTVTNLMYLVGWVKTYFPCHLPITALNPQHVISIPFHCLKTNKKFQTYLCRKLNFPGLFLAQGSKPAAKQKQIRGESVNFQAFFLTPQRPKESISAAKTYRRA